MKKVEPRVLSASCVVPTQRMFCLSSLYGDDAEAYPVVAIKTELVQLGDRQWSREVPILCTQCGIREVFSPEEDDAEFVAATWPPEQDEERLGPLLARIDEFNDEIAVAPPTGKTTPQDINLN